MYTHLHSWGCSQTPLVGWHPGKQIAEDEKKNGVIIDIEMLITCFHKFITPHFYLLHSKL